jgi:hypothetical protein
MLVVLLGATVVGLWSICKMKFIFHEHFFGFPPSALTDPKGEALG